ncbi:hypothetical protein AUR67_00505 [Pseudoalteromonas sp. XI10]|uniref:hypothetical protein n=1 Tax=Pseudoalteromonas sp. XI10 TaxID=1766621 RepID=UPI0007335356|nr:hypothetical protein [Pseudoalteromonas sp. XI10]KTG21993.1 hypothetical protein AUR67_00505 [Pseudoalteromonas sp. XI10]
MKTSTKIKFAKLWAAERDICDQINDAYKKIETAEALEKPTKTLQKKHDSLVSKQAKVHKKIELMLINGELGKDAPKQCRSELGDLYGYVEDCFYEVWDDYLYYLEINAA